MNKRKFLVITPTLGKSLYMDETVASVLNYAPGALHVIVCPLESRERLTRIYPTCEVIEEPANCKSLYSALNHVLLSRDWDWATYINDDDFFLPGFINLYNFLCNNLVDEDIFYGRVVHIKESGVILGDVPLWRFKTGLRSVFSSGVIPLSQPGTVYSSKVLQGVGFDESYRLCADNELVFRSLLANRKVRYFNCRLAAYRIRVGQLSGDISGLRREEARYIVNNRSFKWFWKFMFRMVNINIYAKRIVLSKSIRAQSLFGN
jgi:glycosyltransferase involved in cell wall biosynthesis